VRILLVSDLHYRLPQFDWVEEVAPDFDLVVIAGDLLDISSSVPPAAQLVVIRRHLAQLAAKTRLAVGSGNHDLTGRDDHGEQAALWLQAARDDGVAVDGDSIEVHGALVTVCPWWDGPHGRNVVEAQLATDAARRPDTWIWVYHWAPAQSRTSWTGRTFYGDHDLLGWIEQHRPSVVLAGHVHQPPFEPAGGWCDRIGTTWVFNSGHQIGPVPAHTVVDLGERWARWSSLVGDEQQSLDEAPALARSSLAETTHRPARLS
jgi:Icc-related predicted phosphoesterase